MLKTTRMLSFKKKKN